MMTSYFLHNFYIGPLSFVWSKQLKYCKSNIKNIIKICLQKLKKNEYEKIQRLRIE